MLVSTSVSRSGPRKTSTKAVSSTEAPVSSGAAPVSSYTKMKEALSRECHQALVPALGMTDAFLAVAQAMTVVDRYEQCQLALPACHRSLVSVAMAMSPIADEDAKRKLYLGHVSVKGTVSVQEMRRRECMWAMTLPFKNSVTESS